MIAEFLERWRKKLWSNDDDCDDVAFWDQQKEMKTQAMKQCLLERRRMTTMERRVVMLALK